MINNIYQKPVHIAIIDDGVNEKLYNTGCLLHNIEISRELDVIERTGYNPYKRSHGTTCAAIIKKYAFHTMLSSIKILAEDTLKGVREQLIKALDWCLANSVDVVNISLGTIYYKDFDEIKRAVNHASEKGLIMVCACNNNDIFTYPASLTNVIGVRCMKGGAFPIHNKDMFLYDAFSPDGIEITANANHHITDCYGNTVKTSASNSFAAPYITALVSNILLNNPGMPLHEVKHTLQKLSIGSTEENLGLARNIDWVRRAVLFHLSKSGKFSYEIPYYFECKNIFNIKCSYVSEGLQKIITLISNDEQVIADVDTVVIIVSDIENPMEGTDNLLEDIFAYKKNIIYLNDDAICNFPKLDMIPGARKYWHPSVCHYIYQERTALEPWKYMPRKNPDEVPVVALYDYTNNKLFEIMSKLALLFKNDGYNPLCAADTCIGLAAGFEYMPLKSCSNIIKVLCSSYDPDIFIMGFRSSETIPEYIEALEKYIDIDIKVSIFDRINAALLGGVLKNPGNSKQVILCNNCFQENDSSLDVKMFDLQDMSSADNLYNYIRYLYESEQQIQPVTGNLGGN